MCRDEGRPDTSTRARRAASNKGLEFSSSLFMTEPAVELLSPVTAAGCS